MDTYKNLDSLTDVDGLPNLLIAGWPKCGTTSLFHWLKSHPQICGSRRKETHFLSDQIYPRLNGAANIHEHGLAAYRDLFDLSGEPVILDASPAYYRSSAAIEYASNLSETKVIFLVRSPGEQCYSFYRFNRGSQGVISQSMSFAEYLESEQGRKNHENLNYDGWIREWEKVIGRDRIRVYMIDQLKEMPLSILKELCEWLGIDATFYEDWDGLRVRNQTQVVRFHQLHQIALKMQSVMPNWVRLRGKSLYFKLNTARAASRLSSEEALIDLINEGYRDSILRLADSWNLDLSAWTAQRLK